MRAAFAIILEITVFNLYLFSQPYIFKYFQKIEQLEKSSQSKTERLIFQAEHEFMKTRDPATNSLPDNIKELENQFINNLNSKTTTFKKNSSISSIQTLPWKQRGPWNYGGRFKCVAIDVENDKIINAGAASGGMWHSIDGGESWVKTTQLNVNQSVGCLAQDIREGKTNNWFYGTGELLSTVDRKTTLKTRVLSMGNGIFKSTDNGSSWQVLNSTLSNSPSSLSNHFQGVWNIIVDHKSMNQDVIYAACMGGILRSSNGGETWNCVLGDTANLSFSSYIVQTSEGDYYASISKMTINGAVPSQYGVFYSSDGLDWSNITPKDFPDTTRIIKLATAPSNSNVLYVLTEYPASINDYLQFWSQAHTFWKYTKSKDNNIGIWENRSVFIPKEGSKTLIYFTIGGYCMTLKVKPDDENVVFLCGTNLYRSTSGFSDSSSTTQIGGYFLDYTWDEKSIYCHPDIHWIEFHPSNPNILFCANDGGIHKSINPMDNNVEWITLNHGLFGSQFYSVSIDHASDDEFIYGGLQDNSTMFTDSDDLKKHWTIISGGDGMSTQIADKKDYIIGSMQYGNIITFRLDDNNNPYDIFKQRPSSTGNNDYTFFTNFILDPNDNKTFYLAASSSIFRMNDMQLASRDPNYKEKGWYLLTNARIRYEESISSISISKTPANILIFGSNYGFVYKVEEAHMGNPKGVKIQNPDFPKNGFVSCIEIDSRNADNFFVIFSNYNVPSIFHTTDGGVSWERHGGNLEENPDGTGNGPAIRWIKMLYVNDEPIYFLGTSTGLFSTQKLEGDNTLWVQESPDLIGNLIIDMIVAREKDGYVAVATQGGGVFTTSVKATSSNEKVVDKYPFALYDSYPNPAKNYFEISFSLDKANIIQLNLIDIKGNVVQNLADAYFLAGRHSLKLDSKSLSPGVYFYTLISGNLKLTKKILIVK